MTVHYTGGGGGGLLGSLLGAAAMFVPGLQGVAPYLYGANALMNGDVGGAIGSLAAPQIGKAAGNVFDKAITEAPTNTSLENKLWEAQRTQFQPPDNMDYVNMRMPSQQPINQTLDTAAHLPQTQPDPNESLLRALTRASQAANMNPWLRQWR